MYHHNRNHKPVTKIDIFIKICNIIGYTSVLVGFGGLAGFTESGKGFGLSLILLVIGVYFILWGYRFESEKIRKRYYRIH